MRNFKFQISNFKFILFIIITILIAFTLSPRLWRGSPLATFPFPLYPSFAAGTDCQTQTTNPRAEGLITTPNLNNPAQGSIGSKFGNPQGVCIVNSSAAQLRLPKPRNFDELKSIFYDQSKLEKQVFSAGFPKNFITNGIYATNAPTNIIIDVLNPITGSGTQIFFINGNLTIKKDIIYHTNDSSGGLVFVISGNINIDPQVSQIDAVLISEGTICTAYVGSSCSTSYILTDSPLTINGSLISLGTNPIQFKRTIVNLTEAPEKINAQAKYYIILKNLFTQTVNFTTEE